MNDLVTLLPEIILYIVLGYLFIHSYKFTRILKNANEYQHIFTESLIIGFVLRNIYALIPVSLGLYIDIVVMIISSIIIGYSLARLINSNILNKALKKLKIKQTFNQNIWADIEDKNGAIYVSIFDRETNTITDGILVLYESSERQPLIQLSEFRQVKDDIIINDFSNQPERTILIDTSKYKDVFITYDKNSKKIESWK